MKYIIMIKINSTSWKSYINENDNEFIFDTNEDAEYQLQKLKDTTSNVYTIMSYPEETIV